MDTFLKILTNIGFFGVAMLCLMFMIIVHEFGHYIAGKRLGFKINEFSVGFGPKIFSRVSKKTGEIFSLRWIPLGGYCAFEGEDEDSTSEKSFEKQKPWKRIVVLVSGALFNFMSAIMIISIFFMAYGEFVPKIVSSIQFNNGQENVLLKDDVVLKVNGKNLYSLIDQNAFGNAIGSNNDKISGAKLLVLRDGKEVELNIIKGAYTTEDDKGQSVEKLGYGISFGYDRYKCGIFESAGKAFVFVFKVVEMLFKVIAGLFTGLFTVKDNLGGTITAIDSIMKISRQGFEAVMYGVCVLSSTLAVMNLLPIPALDGSKIVFTSIEWVRGKPIKRSVENKIHIIGFFLLISMTIILDLLHYFG